MMNRRMAVWVLAGCAMLGSGHSQTAVPDPFADPFAPEEKPAAAVVEVPKEPTRFALETFALKATPDAAPQTVTLKLNTATGEVWWFDGARLVSVAMEGLVGPVRQEERNPKPHEDSQREAAVRETMKKTIIPEVDFRQARLEDVMEFLAAASREYDPEKKGVSIIGGGVRLDPGAEAPLVTFQARYVTLSDAFSIVVNLADLKWRVRDGAVVWSLGWLPTDMRTRVFRLHPKVVNMIRVAAHGAAVDEASKVSDALCHEFFRDFGLKWSDGSSLHFSPAMALITATESPEGLALLEELIASMNAGVLATSAPGRFRLHPVDKPDGSRGLLLSDAETGDVREFRGAADAGAAKSFVRVLEP